MEQPVEDRLLRTFCSASKMPDFLRALALLLALLSPFFVIVYLSDVVQTLKGSTFRRVLFCASMIARRVFICLPIAGDAIFVRKQRAPTPGRDKKREVSATKNTATKNTAIRLAGLCVLMPIECRQKTRRAAKRNDNGRSQVPRLGSA